jgi:uncharacterized protein (DUF302 family)
MRKILPAAILLLALTVVTARAGEYGVYLQSVEEASESFDDTVQNVEEAFAGQEWQVLSSYEVSVPEGCGFRAHTVSLHIPDYAEKLLSHGAKAAFALPLRVVVYEDAGGVHVSLVNPSSVNRTVLGDGVEEELSARMAQELSAVLSAAAGGRKVDRQQGQLRKRGKVGGMGGGDFEDKVELLYEAAVTGLPLAELAGRVEEGIRAGKAGWELVYRLDLSSQGVFILGVNSRGMEAKAYSIAGERRRSQEAPCPGIDHAAAFPIEVVIMQDGDTVRAVILDGMYRMKVYFEDAGKWAFMKNMTMPGKIESEIREMSQSRLER